MKKDFTSPCSTICASSEIGVSGFMTDAKFGCGKSSKIACGLSFTKTSSAKTGAVVLTGGCSILGVFSKRGFIFALSKAPF